MCLWCFFEVFFKINILSVAVAIRHSETVTQQTSFIVDDSIIFLSSHSDHLSVLPSFDFRSDDLRRLRHPLLQKFLHLLLQRPPVQKAGLLIARGEPPNLYRRLLRSVGFHHPEAVVFRAGPDEFVDVGAGPVVFQFIRQISEEAPYRRFVGVPRSSQIDDRV